MVSSRKAVVFGFVSLSGCPAGLGAPVGQGGFSGQRHPEVLGKPSLEGCPSPPAMLCFSILRGSLIARTSG
jgi:hypothetical protein